MNKAELVDLVAPAAGSRAAASRAIDAVVDAVIREVAGGGTVSLTGFGTFEQVQRAPRTGRNLRTGEPVPIRAQFQPRFRPSDSFRAVVADPSLLPDGRRAGGRT